jgi:lipid II:glycine glycyltransferase (peptidoglycan interpeptide bridge formation enzyme)
MFEVLRYNSNHKNEWDSFVPKKNNGTIFHLKSFLNYHPKSRFKDHSLLFYKKNKLFSVFPAAQKTINEKSHIISHPGATLGSFVVPEDLSISDALILVQTLKKYCNQNNIDIIQITTPPNLYQYRLSNYMEYSYLRNGFSYQKREVTSILHLENNIDKNLEKFRPSHKRAIKKGERKGLICIESYDFENFYSMLEKNLKTRHGVVPTHTLNELKKLHNIFPEKIKLFCSFYKEIMIAGVLNFIVNEQVVLAFYITHDESYSEIRPLNLLFYKMFEWAIHSEFKIYDFGIFTVNGDPNMGLGRFKENFGSSGIFRDTFEINL